MAGPDLPETPSQLKSIHPYLKIANEHDARDIVVSYWCRLYALQTGLKLSTKTTEETNFLLKLMDWLESMKKANHDNEAITNDVAAQAHIENWALKLFLFADKQDRASNFSKAVIQSFYTAGLLYDILSVFGELSEEVVQNRKYAKWKAAYIHNCLKNGETPIPGPMKEDDDDSNENVDNDSGSMSKSTQPTLPTHPMMPMQPTLPSTPPTNMGAFGFPSVPEPHTYNPAPTPTNPGVGNIAPFNSNTPTLTAGGGFELTVEQTEKAQKYIKWAGSALNYDDVPTTITNLQKALQLLTTGKDPV
ncbi:vacuolar protein sorting-associated protein VTA1 homolog isoform X2 [Copidosoma floridanum]|uniref:vacuolar protein sorting-associated protein VTA1 homolog isoform X2 n=1 Tax=Copidosoma floridanum TaxID=29053 RepID=UPI0006C9E004|nr:vacuolar protein sorting-associated protein VTA1 homolog isoform X2 [Copidosoma floridanum]